MKDFWDKVLSFCQLTTKQIGDQLVKDSGKIQAIKKEDGSLVTKADQWADQSLRDAIQATFPNHGVLTEETTHIFPDNEWCWIIDPIDGTTNFTRGVPVWGISLGLLYQGTPVFGFVYMPSLNQAFHGFWDGNSGLDKDGSDNHRGAFLNNQPISTSQDDPSHSHLFNLCARSLAILQNPFPCKIRMIGVASYNILLVAAGAAIGGVEATPKIWDIAAVWVILQAAGGTFVHLDDQPAFPLTVGKNYGDVPFPSLVVSRKKLVPKFRPLTEVITNKKP